MVGTSQTVDKNLTNMAVATSVALMLGVDVYEEVSICHFCGMVLDKAGIHSLSCTAGGDIVLRHNTIRDIIFYFCSRARLRPELEKVGLLEDECVLVSLRRPADVLVAHPSRTTSVSRHERRALDVKIINALGQDHLSATARHGLAAAEDYRDSQLELLDTYNLCDAAGILYEPLVFTAQGGVERHAESVLSQIATAIATAEDTSPSEVKAEMLQHISLSLARSAAKAVMRRRPRLIGKRHTAASRFMSETRLLQSEMPDE